MINISANLDDVARRLPSEKLARTAMARAINRALDAGKTAAARETAKVYIVRQAQVRDKARVKKVSANNLNTELSFSGPALNIADYRIAPKKPQPAKRPTIRVTVNRSSGAKPYKGAFVVPVRSGTVKVFRRTGKDRLPIVPVWGPSVPQLIGSERVSTAVQERMREVVVTRLEHEISRALAKGGK